MVRRQVAAPALLRELAFVVGSFGDVAAVRRLMRTRFMAIKDDQGLGRMQMALVAGLGEGLRRSKKNLADVLEGIPAASAHVWEKIADAEQSASGRDDSRTEQDCELSLAILVFAPWDQAEPAIASLLAPQRSQALQLAAVRTAVATGRIEATQLLLAGWSGYSPAIRGEVVDALLTRVEYLNALFDAIERGVVPASYVAATRRALLVKHADAEIRARAEKLFSGAADSPRKEVVAQFQPVLQLAGDAERGRAVFKRNCAACHRFGDAGSDVGPNLAQIRHRSPGEMLIAILDPNREVGPNFLQFAATLDDGRVVIGLVTSETPTSITLHRAEGQQETILRSDLEQLASTGLSLMPEGFEKKLAPQEIADVIALLKAGP